VLRIFPREIDTEVKGLNVGPEHIPQYADRLRDLGPGTFRDRPPDQAESEPEADVDGQPLSLCRYMLWRLLYTIPTDDPASMVLGSVVYLAELYGLCQFCFFTYQSWSPTERTPAPITIYPTVDIMVTVVDEPLSILRQTLISCLAQEYPRDRFTVYVWAQL
jgi:hypothetical protein